MNYCFLGLFKENFCYKFSDYFQLPYHRKFCCCYDAFTPQVSLGLTPLEGWFWVPKDQIRVRQ